MDQSTRRIIRLFTGIGLGAIFATATACSSSPRAPLHVYNSPLLAGEMTTPEPRNRKFDPMKTGDFPEQDTVYVVNDAEKDDTQQTASPTRQDDAQVVPTTIAQADPAPEKASQPAPAAEADEPTRKEKKVELQPLLSNRSVGGHAKKDSSRSALPDGGASFTPSKAADYVWSVYQLNEVEFPEKAREDVATLYRTCKETGRVYHGSRPTAGDIVFFHNTFDASDDGRNNDWYTHVGIVESVDGRGTAIVLGYQSGSVARLHLNLENPDSVELDGEPANSQLRQPASDDAPFTQYYAGQLFAGFCSVLGDQKDFLIVDNWQPGMKLDP